LAVDREALWGSAEGTQQMSDERYARRRKGAGEQIAPNALTSPRLGIQVNDHLS
jgi:hypothetical protein